MAMNSTLQVLEFWRWKRMEIDAEIKRHPNRDDLRMWRSEITVKIEALQRQLLQEQAKERR